MQGDIPEVAEIGGIRADIYGEIDQSMPAVILCPPHPLYGGSRRDIRLVRIAETLSSAGITAIPLDYSRYDRGCGEIEDVITVIDSLSEKVRWVGLLGYSFGAVVGSNAAARTNISLRGFVALSILERIDDIKADLSFDTPKLFIHGKYDSIAPLSAFRKLCEDAKGEKYWLILETDHFYAGMLSRVAQAVLEFFKKR